MAIPKSIVNLKMLVVISEIEKAIGTHYQHIFANADLRQELIAYILSRVRNVHTTVEKGEKLQLNAETVPCLTGIQLQIENFIHQGIRHLLQKYGSLMSHCTVDGNYGDLTTPHCFN